MREKYLKVLFGNKSKAIAGDFTYKLDEINIAENWNPSETDFVKVGGFCYADEKSILRWLIRGNVLYDVIIPDEANIVIRKNKSCPTCVYKTDMIILTNPRQMTDEMAMKYYKLSELSEEDYFKSLAGLAICGYVKTAERLIRDRINEGNVARAIKDYESFRMPVQNFTNSLENYNYVYDLLMQIYKKKTTP